jgi:formate hydrogenlyase subunit 3/multisubunit Na+/H+ antiporter MnhD subunit
MPLWAWSLLIIVGGLAIAQIIWRWGRRKKILYFRTPDTLWVVRGNVGMALSICFIVIIKTVFIDSIKTIATADTLFCLLPLLFFTICTLTGIFSSGVKDFTPPPKESN